MRYFNSILFVLGMFVIFQTSSSSEIVPKIYTSKSFIVEEYPIARENLYNKTLNHMKRREKWRERLVITEDDLIGTIHTKIKPLGYRFLRIWGFQRWNFYRGKEVLAKELYDIEGFSIDKQKKNFVFLARQWEKSL